jgi:hypothetical protein
VGKVLQAAVVVELVLWESMPFLLAVLLSQAQEAMVHPLIHLGYQ